MPTPVIALGPNISGVPFAKGATAAATAACTVTLAARPGERYVIQSVTLTSAGIAAVSLDVTISNIADETGAAQTVTLKYVENANGAPVCFSFGADGLWSLPNTQVVVQIPANGASAASAIVVSGLKVGL